MPMKLGTKMFEAKTSVISAMYMCFSCGARDRETGIAAL
jgi:hypothetical protein